MGGSLIHELSSAVLAGMNEGVAHDDLLRAAEFDRAEGDVADTGSSLEKEDRCRRNSPEVESHLRPVLAHSPQEGSCSSHLILRLRQ